jgi:hypothetical protein
MARRGVGDAEDESQRGSLPHNNKKCVKRIGVAELQETHRRQRGERRDHLEGDPRKNLQHDQGESGGGERECPGVSPSATVTFSCRGSWT